MDPRIFPVFVSRFFLGACVLLWLINLPLAEAAMVIRQYDPDIHDRFDTDRQGADFLAEPFDLSGVGRTAGPWGTLVSPTIFVSANHYHPAIGDLLRFYHTNDPDGTYEERMVTGGRRVTSGSSATDIWVGELDSSVSSMVTSYEIADSLQQNQYVLNLGLDESGTYTSQRVGDNTVTAASIATFQSVFTDAWIYEYVYDDPESGGNPDETLQKGGDSGGPTFTVESGTLRLLGIHSLTADADPAGTSDGDFSVDSLLIPYKNEILGISPIPEPSPFLLLVLGGLFLVLHHRRRR